MITRQLIKITCLSFFISSLNISAQQIKKTKILILGTVHLNTIDGVQEKHLTHILDSLTTFKFNAIAVEQMPPELINDIKSRESKSWRELFSYYKKNYELGEKMQKKYNLNYEVALSKKDSLLKKLLIKEEDRLDLIKFSLCSFDIWSAVLQYQFIKDKNKIDSETTKILDKYTASINEINLIGVNLAKRLNINKINYIDNLQDETILNNKFPLFFDEYGIAKIKIDKMVSEVTIYNEVQNLTNNCLKNKDLFPLYKLLNSEKYIKEDYAGQWELWLKTNFKSKTDRSRYSLWEMRNLQITANIMNLVAEEPEKNILVIIGASHKLFLEKYLSNMPDVELLKF